jgi:hypothetical protein
MTSEQAEAEKQKPNWRIRMFLSNEDREELDKSIEIYTVLVGTKMNVIPNKTKKQAYDKILTSLDSPVGANKLNPVTGKVELATWDDFFEKYINYDPYSSKKVSYADIAKLSQKAWKGSGAVRQSSDKSFKKSLFYTSKIKVKSEIYAELGKIYIDAARRLGLMEFDISSVETGGDDKKTIEIIEKGDSVGFRKMEDLITSADIFEEYFERGMSDEDEEDALNYLTMDTSSFNIFCNLYFDREYSNYIWNKCEVEIALGIKEYFKIKYPASLIGQSLSNSIESWRADSIQKEHGRALFNPILNWTMGRSGIKDSGNVVSNPKMKLKERINSFLYGQGNFTPIADHVKAFNDMSYPNKIIDFDTKHLMYDCLNDTSKVSSPIIGQAYSEASELNAVDRSMFLNYISDKKNTDFEMKFIESLMKQEYFDTTFKNPNSPLGNPAEIKGIEKGTGSTKPLDKGQHLSVQGTPYFRKNWRKAINNRMIKSLDTRTKKLAKEREERIRQNRDYEFLNDDKLALTDYQVVYDGKLAEIETIDFDSGKADIIIDILDAQGKIVDAETITVDISELRHADLLRK